MIDIGITDYHKLIYDVNDFENGLNSFTTFTGVYYDNDTMPKWTEVVLDNDNNPEGPEGDITFIYMNMEMLESLRRTMVSA